jgi:hypothetical protein
LLLVASEGETSEGTEATEATKATEVECTTLTTSEEELKEADNRCVVLVLLCGCCLTLGFFSACLSFSCDSLGFSQLTCDSFTFSCLSLKSGDSFSFSSLSFNACCLFCCCSCCSCCFFFKLFLGLVACWVSTAWCNDGLRDWKSLDCCCLAI